MSPGSWAMHSSARAWLVRKLQLLLDSHYNPDSRNRLHVLNFKYMLFWVSAGADCRTVNHSGSRKGRRMEPFLVAIVVIVGGGCFLVRYLRARTAH
jgi:hypothetical protein